MTAPALIIIPNYYNTPPYAIFNSIVQKISPRFLADRAAVRALLSAKWQVLYKSIWLFPAAITLLLLLFTVCAINGSSMGRYSQIFYGRGHADSNLLFGRPREIRGDEWVVNTQMTIAQENNHFKRVNQNIGNGQDMSVVLDVPYADWSIVFRPHNLAFFALPLDFAFAFKWWLLAYLLLLSCYFFILELLPGKRLLAAGLSIGLLFGAMMQWWYQYITLGPVYYSLFIATATIHLFKAKRLLHAGLWAALIGYLAACFALVLYPPFQIACLLALSAFGIGYVAQLTQGMSRKIIWQRLGLLAAALLVAGSVVLLFVETRSNVIHAITHSAYPGERVLPSGGFDPTHIFSGNLGVLFLSMGRSNQYVLNTGVSNQSEASNFILLLPFLFLPSLYFLFQDFRKKRSIDWPLLSTNLGFLGFLAWMLVPHLETVGRFLFLDKVQTGRLLLGLGLLNLFQLVLVIRRLQDFKGILLNKKYVLAYAVAVFLLGLCLGLHTLGRSPGFITPFQMLILSIPVPVVVYLLLRKRFNLAMLGFVAFSVFTTILVNPFYHGTTTVTQTPLSQAIRSINAAAPGTWVSENMYIENFAAMNGAHSLSGVFAYPQLNLWRPSGGDEDIYNRYAHVGFKFNRQPDVIVPTSLAMPGADHFDVITEPCGNYTRQLRIRYILTTQAFTDSCLHHVRSVTYPRRTFLIYEVQP